MRATDSSLDKEQKRRRRPAAESTVQANPLPRLFSAAGSSANGEQLLGLQRLIGNQATLRVPKRPQARDVQRRIDSAKVEETAKFLGVKNEVHAVEVPKDSKVKSLTPFSSYPKDNTLNLDALGSMSMLELQYPNEMADEGLRSMSADDIVDMMGGGAYNHTKDLVVLGQGYSEAALVHEMGHKAQNEVGINADSALVIVLEYHNFLINENGSWLLGKTNGKPRLSYATPPPKLKGPAKSWDDLKAALKAKWHHVKPETMGMVEEIESVLGSRYATESDRNGSYQEQAKKNLIAEYFNSQ